MMLARRPRKRWLLIPVGGFFVVAALGLGNHVYRHWQEERDYDQAPPCGPDETARQDSRGCKLVTEVPFEGVTCNGRQLTSQCDYRFQVPVDGSTKSRGAYLDEDLQPLLHPGDRLRVELLNGQITKVITEVITKVARPGSALPDVAMPHRSVSIVPVVALATLLFGLLLVCIGLRRP